MPVTIRRLLAVLAPLTAAASQVSHDNADSPRQYPAPLWARLFAVLAWGTVGLVYALPVPVYAQATTGSASGRQLMRQLGQCIQRELIRSRPSVDALQLASMTCTFREIVLTPDGKVRPDADERMTALIEASGVRLPSPVSQGQVSLPLRSLPDRVFSVPVQIGNQTQDFLLDTGASSSLINSQLAKELRLQGTPIPSELLSYMVVGDHCDQVSATIHPLPPLQVGMARVQGLTGMGMAQRHIPSQLAGVLGIDFLSSFDLIIDPRLPQLQLLPRSQPSPSGIPLSNKLGLMTVQVRINGQGPFTLALDTGATWMVLSPSLAQRLRLNLATAESVSVQGFCGLETTKKLALNRVSLQTYHADNLEAIVLLNSAPLDLLGVDGLVGQNFLNRYHQQWRFGDRGALGYPTTGSLTLTPLSN